MTEQFRPQPENPKRHAPEAGAGPLGLPPPSPEGERPRGELTPEQKQNSPQTGEGLPGLSDRQQEEPSHIGGFQSQETECEQRIRADIFFNKLAKITKMPPLGEDFYERLRDRLKQGPRRNQEW